MKRRRIEYSESELDWIEKHAHLKRAELCNKFCNKFNRGDVSVDNIKSLCTRRGWLNTAPRQKRHFSKEEIQWVSNNYTRPRKEMHRDFCAKFNRTDIEVVHLNTLCARNRWVSQPHRPPIKYTTQELEWIKANATQPRSELHTEFVTRFGGNDVKPDDIKSLCTRNGWKTGRTGCYAKGHVPYNKGKKMPYNANSARTQFKPGAVPANLMPIGHERLDKTGYTLIKIDVKNPHTGYRGRYVMKHKHLWEQKNGPVPDGMCLKALDGNRLNCDPDNWELMDRGMLPRLNGKNNRDYDNAPAELKPTILLTAKIEHKIHEIKKAEVNNDR